MNMATNFKTQIIDHISYFNEKIPAKYRKYILIAFGGLSFCSLRYIFWKLYNKHKSYPNGPLGLPFLGCLISFGSNPLKFLYNVPSVYGGIAYFPLILANNVIISDPKILRQLYQKEKINDRPHLAARPVSSFIVMNGKEWTERRKYVMSTVVSITNTSFVLYKVNETLNEFIAPILDDKYIKNKQLWHPKDYMQYMAFNSIWTAVFGKALSFDDPIVSDMAKVLEKIMVAASIQIMVDFVTNFSVKLPNFIRWHLGWKVEKEGDDVLIDWMRNNGFIIDAERNILNRTSEKQVHDKATVYIDLLIQKVKNKEITVDKVISDVKEIAVAALDTTSKTSEYGIILLAKHPNIQQMVYGELVKVMEANDLKEFDFSILNQLHIFRAFIHEVLRVSTVTPMGAAPHTVYADHETVIDGKRVVIPEGTLLHSNTHYMHKYLDWNDDNKPLKEENNDIHLEYWLDVDNGDKFKMNENFSLFGVGKRNCVGQTLAMKQLYAFFGLMMTRYKFIAPNNDPDAINIKQSMGFVLEINPSIGVNVQKR